MSSAITKSIAEFAISADVEKNTTELRRQVLRAMTDTIGVAIAGRHDAGVRILAETTRHEVAEGVSTVLINGQHTNESEAALMNGMASHALDYDDVNNSIYGHPSAALIPALLAVAEANGNSGSELVDAYVVGYQVMCAVAAGMEIRAHYSKGWHSTVTTGVLAATAAVSRLLNMKAGAVRHALGIAASMVSGSRQNFGTMTKPLHPGIEARNAIFAARLAANGFTADPDQLEGHLGYFSMFGEGGQIANVTEHLDRRWALLNDGINIKKYPCCYNAHRTADATLAIAQRATINVDQITSLHVTLEPGGADPLIRHQPVTGLEAKFSAEYVTAAGLLDGRVNLASFTDDSVTRSDVQRLLRKVSINESVKPPFGPPEWNFAYSTVEVVTENDVIRERVDIPRGDARVPLSDDELEAKFRDCVEYSQTGWSSDWLLARIRTLDSATTVSGFLVPTRST